MIWLTIVSDLLLYGVVSFLAGVIVLQFVPEHRKPAVAVTKPLILLAVASIPILTAAPAIQLAGLLRNNMDFGSAIWMAISEFSVGQSLAFNLFLAFFWFGAVAVNSSKWIQAFWFLLVIINIGFGSHAASVDFLPGLFSHTLHFLSLSLWAGVLLLVTWFSTELTNWRSFLKWFTPFAFGMVAILLLSGFAIWLLFSKPEDYVASWVLPYGQMLLLKHLSILPLLAAAFLNGLGNKTKLPSRRLLKLETFMLGLVFLFTAIMSKLAPPHEITNTLLTEGTAPFAELLSGKVLLPVEPQFALSVDGLLLLLIGTISIGLLIMSFFRKIPLWLSCTAGLIFVAAVYIGLMMNLTF
ncbi:copper resistance D family protein [Planococcus sp. CAU13]|uniref:copper resistance D family protein n=1 Tax=Planococcus sp. CAU13 TaxID=1541197 RepID=UPI00052FF449|nr:CopD family protein [Planococcus sp. CAU13]